MGGIKLSDKISLESMVSSGCSVSRNKSPLEGPPPKRYRLDEERKSKTIKFKMQVSDDYAKVQDTLKNLEIENKELVELIEECFSLSNNNDKFKEWKLKVENLFKEIAKNRIPKQELPIRKIDGYFNVGLYHDGYPGELFIHAGKQGDETHGWVNSFGKAISIMLQHGIRPKKIYKEFKYDEFQPKGITNLKQALFCKSIIDMIMKYMESSFIPTNELIDDDGDEYFTMVDIIVDEKKQ